MWFSVDFSSHVPVYKQIKEKIKALISVGILKKGDFVPSIRSLAEDLGVNLNTVARAYRELVLEGVLQPVRGEGYVVAELDRETFVAKMLDEFKRVVDECKKAGIDQNVLLDVIKEVFGRDEK
ncbi:GntR family transcriptional regulator [Pseudothermotoga thermarum]|uniref:Transcriptional regulator, GntR family n=1 Tax=Pseudothermotoga thermarum DSM 5069 TaxID=688269 RepID=F7YWK3_9THEM|nr:GntR family transcriptional regulator [Pseudothermotoga thermarum]AEH51984.1 transcriptional regulator, GntR family [Pseudothermotoga thermarum DSM 5069]